MLVGAQEALGKPSSGAGWDTLNLSYPPTAQTSAKFIALMKAIGRGIGTASAHEMGHHHDGIGGLRFMDCGAGNLSRTEGAFACEADDNFVYGFFNGDGFPQTGGDSQGAQEFYVDVPGRPIHWSPSDDCWWWKYGTGAKDCSQKK
jgi:hypothetical protein